MKHVIISFGKWDRASCDKYLKLVKPIRLASDMKSLAPELDGNMIGIIVSVRAGEGGRKPCCIFLAALCFISERVVVSLDHSFLRDSMSTRLPG